MKKLKIALYVPTLLGGGAEKVFVNLANYFVESNAEVYLLSSKEGVYFDLLDKRVRHFSLRSPKGKFMMGGINLLAPFRVLNAFFSVCFFLIRKKPDVLMCTLTEANIIGALGVKLTFSNSKLILRQAAKVSNAYKNRSFKDRVSNSILKRIYSAADLIIANSPDTADSISNDLNVKGEKIHVIGNPVYNKRIVDLAEAKIEHKWFNTPTKYLLAVGSLREIKGFDVLLKSFAIVKSKELIDIKLIILGEGPRRNDLIELSKSLNIHSDVDFYGFVNNPYPFYKNASLFVVSSFYEGFGNVLVEALSFGLPVVSTSCEGGPVYILDNGKYGELVPVKNPEIMADAIISNLLVKKFPKENLENRAKEFSIDFIGDVYLNKILSLL